MGQKCCLSCNQIKQIVDFYKHPGMADGHLNKCSECCKRDVKKHREENLEYYKNYDRKRNSLPHRIEARNIYQKTIQGKNAGRKAKIKWKMNNLDRRAAHVIFGNAIKKGQIIKKPCEICGSVYRIHGHHDDYTKPLEVKWLCSKHHKEVHKNVKRQTRGSDSIPAV